MEWILLITNVPGERLSVSDLVLLYRMRWQIEICFKALKSSLDFDVYGNLGIDYFKCLLYGRYGRLLLVLIMMQINSICKTRFYSEHKRLISIQSFFKNLRNRAEEFIRAFINPTKKNLNILMEVMKSVMHKSLFEVRKRKSTEQQLLDLDLFYLCR